MTLNKYYRWALVSLIISILITIFTDVLKNFLVIREQDVDHLSNAFLYPALVLVGAGWRENRRQKQE